MQHASGVADLPNAPTIRRASAWWAIGAVFVVWIGACVPLLGNVGYYFVDDSQVDMYGKLWEIGARILRGDWSLVNPHAWQAGNYLAEQYWGVHSPVLWLFGLITHALPNGLVAMTALKLVLFATATIGTYLLARSASANPALAAVSAAAVPLAGFTLYMDAASWMNGFTAWALVPLAWWSTRRFLSQRGTPVLPFVLVYSVVSINYIHASIVLGVILLAEGIQAIAQRNRPAIWSSVVLGAFWILAVVAIHLPGVLTSPASGRSSSIANDGFLVATLSGYATSAIGSTQTKIGYFGDQQFVAVPLMYISWLLPLLALVDWKRARSILFPGLLSLVLVGSFILLATMGPSQLGPLRFPIRVLPYGVVAVMVILGVLLSRSRAKFSTPRTLAVFGILALSAALAFFQAPGSVLWIVLCTVIAAAGIFVILRLLRKTNVPWRKVGAAAAAATVVIVGIQHIPASSAPLRNYKVPTNVSAYERSIPTAVGDAIVVGDAATTGSLHPTAYSEALVGNLWYANSASVQNVYSAVYNPAYNSVTCMNYTGSTCGQLFTKLFTPQPLTGETLADLLGVSTVVTLKDAVSATELGTIPAGWKITEENTFTVVIVRDQPVAPAGSVVWADSSTRVKMVSADNMSASFRVLSTGPHGGQVALSRIPWPGYVVSGGSLSKDLVEGFLMGVDIPAGSAGSVVTVNFRSPGEPIVVASFAALPLLLVFGILGRQMEWRPRRLRWRRRRGDADQNPTTV